MDNNKLIIAAAGSGKTTYLVNEAIKQKAERVLITTYTQANEAEIKKKLFKINKCIPENINIQTWFSFLLKHGVRPYQPILFEKKIKGLLLVNNQSALKYRTKYGVPVYFKEDAEFERHYFSKETKIYSDKLSKFVFRCNQKSDGAIIDRLSRIYSHIFIDEVQDLAGYDLEILKLFFNCSSKVLLVGDPRQGTYSTNTTAKYKKFRKSEIVSFFQVKSPNIVTDDSSLLVNFRSNPQICKLSNNLFPESPKTTSGNSDKTGHDGVFFIRTSDVEYYLNTYKPVQLRDTIRRKVNETFRAMNFGESKGLTFARALIYPTKPILEWIFDNSKELAPTSRSKFYVALTRAKYSVGIVFDFDNHTKIDGIINYIANSQV